jgi:hypothetical protein
MVELYQPTSRRESPPSLRAAVPRIAVPRQIPVRPVLYGLGSLVFIAVLGFAWTWYQDVQHTLREGDSSLRALRLGTPTVTGARLPTPFAIAIASPSPTATPTPEPSPSPTPVIDGILVEFRTTARVYVEAAVDGKQVMAETIGAGEQRSLPLGNDTVVMRVSNGMAVDITVNNVRQQPQSATDPVELSWKR